MKKEVEYLFDIISRYLILILLGVTGVNFFYLLFSTITIYPVYFLLKLFFDASLAGNTIVIGTSPIEIIGACVAGSAYYLLLILNLSTKGIELEKRIYMLLFSFSSLLVINILRIFFLSVIFASGFSFFDVTHKLFWYVGSTVFVVGIWFLSVKMFKVKEIPVYSDIAFLLNSGKKVKKTKRSKKH